KRAPSAVPKTASNASALQPPASPPKLRARSRDPSPLPAAAAAPAETSAPSGALQLPASKVPDYGRSPSPSPAKHSRAKSSSSPAVAIELHVAWVDNDITTREHLGSASVLQRECASAKLTSLKSTAEALAWLRGLPAPTGSATRKALIISSRFRQADGG